MNFLLKNNKNKSTYLLLVSIALFVLSGLLFFHYQHNSHKTINLDKEIDIYINKIIGQKNISSNANINGLKIEEVTPQKVIILKDFAPEYLYYDNLQNKFDTIISLDKLNSSRQYSFIFTEAASEHINVQLATDMRLDKDLTFISNENHILFKKEYPINSISILVKNILALLGLLLFIFGLRLTEWSFGKHAISLVIAMLYSIFLHSSYNYPLLNGWQLFDIGIVSWCITILINTQTKLFSSKENKDSDAILPLFYSWAIISFAGLIFILYYNIYHAPHLLNIKSIVGTSINGILFLIGFLLLIFSKFYITYKLNIKLINRFSLKSRLVAIMLSSIIFGVICITLLPIHYGIYLAFAFTTYLLLLDLFAEKQSFSIIWISAWMTFFCALTALLIFKSHLDSELKINKQNLLQLEASFQSNSFDYSQLENENIDFPIALYKNGNLVYANVYFPPAIDKPINKWSISNVHNLHYIIYDAGDLVLVTKQDYEQLIKPLSLFSYLFLLTGILMFSMLVINKYIYILPKELDFHINKSSLISKIQFSVVGLIVFSFIGIGFVSAYYFNQLSISNETNRIQDSTLNLAEKINQTIDTYKNESTEKLQLSLANITSDRSINFRVFNVDKLIYSSLSNDNENINRIFTNPNFILNKSDSHFFISEYNQEVYSTKLLVNTNTQLRFSASDFLSAMLNIYVFLFLIALSIAIAVSNSITKPLTLLGEKLGAIKLGKTNERIEWKSKDELGTLINEYNSMLEQLEQSALVMARSERDSAWREMSQQVAHEIKNPLTPMKLSIQYLERSVSLHPERAQEMIKRVSNTLIEQIDNLSQIANEFSNFGALPKAKNDKMVLNEVVQAVHDLFRKREDIIVMLQEPIDDIIVFADKNHMIRILNNLVKNAIQAIPEDKKGNVLIKLYKNDKMGIILVRDNGTGIPLEMQNKVFTPNFTTKSSGTGLGLAIASNMIESCNGRIFFETKLNEGTDFYVELPLLRIIDNTDKQRVSLD